MRRPGSAALIAALLVLAGVVPATSAEKKFTEDFMLETCKGFSSQGRNPFFILEPGYELRLRGREDGDDVRLRIKVLHRTLKIGAVTTRVVEERHTRNGVLEELSLNYFAICNRNNNVIYFGEDVDIFHDDGSVTHDGAWRAFQNGAEPGIIMPGTILLGARYFQEVAPGVALDQAEIVAMNEIVTTPAGTFTGCVKIKETTPLEPQAVDFKLHCPNIGLVKDGVLRLTFASALDDDDED